MMRKGNRAITRRDFLRGTAYGAFGAVLGLGSLGQAKAEGRGTKEEVRKVKVVLVRDAKALDSRGNINGKVIQEMLDKAVCKLLGKKDPVAAWKVLVKPTEVVGIKSNVWEPLCTPKEVEEAIKRRLMDAGVPERNIGIDDRGVLNNPIFLKATALINTRPMRWHAWSGVGTCIKNYLMFVSNPPEYHPDSCADLGAIWNLPIVKGKTRLNILVLLTPQFHGLGRHHFDPKYTWEYKGLLVGRDPVAVDAVGLRIIQLKRLAYFGEEKPIAPPPKHIVVADVKHKIGVSDLRKIEIMKVGWEKESLI